MKRRKKPDVRKGEIIEAGLKLAEEIGVMNINRTNVGKRADVAAPTISYHFGTADQMRRAVMRHALKVKNLKVLADVIVAKDAFAEKIPSAVKAEALGHLL